jgi:hypothetical protein
MVLHAAVTHYNDFNGVRVLIAGLNDTHSRRVQVRGGNAGAYGPAICGG